MNRISTLILLFILMPVLSIAQNHEHTEILQICINESEVQSILATTGSPIIVMQHGISFSIENELNVAGKDVLFLEKNEINRQQIESFFLFWRFDVNSDDALIEYIYQINEKESIAIEMRLIRTGSIWEVIASRNERRSI